LGLPLFRCDQLEQLFAILNQALINLPNLSLAVGSSNWKVQLKINVKFRAGAQYTEKCSARLALSKKTESLAGLSEL
jgi:hypothetical protein